ncbi:fimbrial protein [Enterobacteriaceae bacterium YMB-R22]|jgi:type 1 fimbria pilin|uniref:fimbrial protein n=1 Tax=Tenebrionicola larvae TaxID=2815733 RepID=UPI002012F8F8|nr:fimbrial protein [Tenebrionicola larvae]MBV4414030.1 fimbrial protein [Tenebrionicola larvae]
MALLNVIRRNSHAICVFALSMLPLGAWAKVNGELTPASGYNTNYLISLSNQDIKDNNPGGQVTQGFKLDQTYKADAYCTTQYNAQPVFFLSTASLPPSSENPGYLTLNEYMDVKITIHIEGANNGELVVPFGPVSNNYNQNYCVPGGIPTLVNVFRSGSEGNVTFKLKKKIINGITLVGTEVARLYGRLGPGTMGSTPLATVTIQSAIITVPDKCVINDGQPINVDFGEVGNSSTKLNGVNYAQNVPIKVQCQGGSFATGNLAIKLGIQQANPASFNRDYLGTTGSVDRSNLGIVLKDRSGNTVVPNTFYDIPGFDENRGEWNLTAAPIAKAGTMIPEGDFNASATVIAQFQ